MIVATDNGFGLKEDKLNSPIRHGGSKDFPRQLDKVLRKKQLSETSKNQIESRRADPRDKAHYGKRSSAERIPREENIASDKGKARAATESDVVSGKDRESEEAGAMTAAIQEEAQGVNESEAQLNQAAQPPIIPHLQDTFVLKPEDIGESEQLAHASLALTSTTPVEGEEFLTPASRAGAGTAFAVASYRMSPHGQGEMQAAVEAGNALPGATLPGTEVVEAAPSTAKELAFKETLFQQAKSVDGGEALKNSDVVSFSEIALHEKITDTDRILLEKGLAKESAQARNKLMSELGFDTEAGPMETTEAGEEAQAILRKGVGNHPLLDGVSLARTRRELSGMTQPVAAENSQDVLVPVGSLQEAAESSGSEAKAVLSKAGDEQVVAKEMIERIAREAKWMVTNRRTELSIKLSPEHLGELHLKVRQEKDGVFRVEMIVDNQAAKSLLESNMADLKNRLMQEVGTGQDFMFNVDMNNGHEAHPDMQASRPDAETRRMAAAPLALDEALATSQGKAVYGDGRLSIYA